MMTEQNKIQTERSDVEWITSTEQGRRFCWGLLSHCGIYRDIEGSDVQMHKQIGRRQVGLHLLSLISDASEDRLFKMMQEAKNRFLEEKLENERSIKHTGSSTSIDHLIGDTDDFPSFTNESGSSRNPIF